MNGANNVVHLANSFHSSRLYGFLCELRRRKVYRVAAGYAVGGWLIIQVAVTIFPILDLPDWATRLVVLPDPRRLSDRARSRLGL